MADKKFQHIWEFRTRDDASSDDDTRSMSSDDQTDTNLCNEANCYLPQNRCVMPGRCNSTHSQAVEVNEKKAEKAVKKKKKKVVQKKATRVKGTKRKVEADMVKDLKMHADSLVHELAVARADMVARMGEEMKKVVGSGSGLEARAKYVRRVPDKKGNISLIHEKQTGSDKLRLLAMVPSTSENRLVSTAHLPLPGVRDRRINCMDLNDPIPNNSISHGFAGIQAEGFGRFSGGQLGFRVTSRQGGDCSDMSNLSCCENSIRDENGASLTIGGYVGRNMMSSEGMIGGTSITKTMSFRVEEHSTLQP